MVSRNSPSSTREIITGHPLEPESKLGAVLKQNGAVPRIRKPQARGVDWSRSVAEFGERSSQTLVLLLKSIAPLLCASWSSHVTSLARIAMPVRQTLVGEPHGEPSPEGVTLKRRSRVKSLDSALSNRPRKASSKSFGRDLDRSSSQTFQNK